MRLLQRRRRRRRPVAHVPYPVCSCGRILSSLDLVIDCSRKGHNTGLGPEDA